ncbi:unnamed protein product [Coccothraustes coccothraustes]
MPGRTRERLSLCFAARFHAALSLPEEQWDLSMSPQLISELICNAVIGSVTIHCSTVAILHNTVKLPAATVAAASPRPSHSALGPGVKENFGSIKSLMPATLCLP